MERVVFEQLQIWKEKANRKPLIIRGARQTGKTWLMKEFGKRCFAETVYINFENDCWPSPALRSPIRPCSSSTKPRRASTPTPNNSCSAEWTRSCADEPLSSSPTAFQPCAMPTKSSFSTTDASSSTVRTTNCSDSVANTTNSTPATPRCWRNAIAFPEKPSKNFS